MLLPTSRGPISASIVRALKRQDPDLLTIPTDERHSDPLLDEDLQLSLWLCYELHYQGFEDTDPSWEWQPELIAVRRELERELLGGLRRDVQVPELDGDTTVAAGLRQLVEDDDGPSLSRYLQRDATAEQFREFVIHRSIYQLKEADPHTWAIPRLPSRAKAALVEIQVDEYGGGDPARMHSELYRTLMRGLELDDGYGAYLESAPAVALAISNVMSLFGLRRELRGALVGHLAAYEMTSSTPCRRYARGLRRLGGSDRTCQFYDEHVTADALHEQLAAHDLCGGLAEAEPELTGDIMFGAATSLYVDTRFAEYVLGRWQSHGTSLRRPAYDRAAAIVA